VGCGRKKGKRWGIGGGEETLDLVVKYGNDSGITGQRVIRDTEGDRAGPMLEEGASKTNGDLEKKLRVQTNQLLPNSRNTLGREKNQRPNSPQGYENVGGYQEKTVWANLLGVGGKEGRQIQNNGKKIGKIGALPKNEKFLNNLILGPVHGPGRLWRGGGTCPGRKIGGWSPYFV